MGHLETTSIRLINCEVSSDSDGNIIVKKTSGETHVFPKKLKPYFDELKQGTTIQNITINLVRNVNIPPNYGLLYRLLLKLVDLDLVTQRDFFHQKLTEYDQRSSWSGSSLESGPILARFDSGMRAERSSISIGSVLAVLVIAACSLQINNFKAFDADQDFLIFNNNVTFSLLAIYMFASLILNFQTLATSIIAFVHSGRFPQLSLRVTWLGTYLRIDNWQEYRGPSSALLLLAHSALLLFSGHIAMLLEKYTTYGSDLMAVAGLLLLAQWSPFVDSTMTRLLGLLRTGEEKGSPSKTKLIKGSYFIGTVIWLFAAILFFESFFLQLLTNITDIISTSPSKEKVFAGALGVYFIGYIILLINDAVEFFRASADTKDLVHMWGPNPSANSLKFAKEAGPSDILSQVIPFKYMNPALQKKIAGNAHRIEAKKGTAVCRQGKIEREMYVLLSGQAGVYKYNRFTKWHKIVELSPGSVFGEVGFFTEDPRSAYVICQENCQLLSIKHPQQGDIRRMPEEIFRAMQDRIWLMQTLASSKTWAGVPNEALDRFLNVGETFNVKVNKTIINEGDQPDGFYVIIQGLASAIKGGKQLRVMERGDVFGEIALLKNLRRTASVVASSDIKLLHIPQDKFWEVLSENFGFALYLEKMAKSRLLEHQ